MAFQKDRVPSMKNVMTCFESIESMRQRSSLLIKIEEKLNGQFKDNINQLFSWCIRKVIKGFQASYTSVIYNVKLQ